MGCKLRSVVCGLCCLFALLVKGTDPVHLSRHFNAIALRFWFSRATNSSPPVAPRSMAILLCLRCASMSLHHATARAAAQAQRIPPQKHELIRIEDWTAKQQAEPSHIYTRVNPLGFSSSNNSKSLCLGLGPCLGLGLCGCLALLAKSASPLNLGGHIYDATSSLLDLFACRL